MYKDEKQMGLLKEAIEAGKESGYVTGFNSAAFLDRMKLKYDGER